MASKVVGIHKTTADVESKERECENGCHYALNFVAILPVQTKHLSVSMLSSTSTIVKRCSSAPIVLLDFTVRKWQSKMCLNC